MRTQQTFTEDFDDIYAYYNDTEKGKELLRLEGISRDYLDIGIMSKNYFTKHIPDFSTDANANANEGISQNNYSSEIVKGVSKLDGLFLLFHYAKKRFGRSRATELVKAIIRGDVYFHDSTKVQVPYCFAFSTSILMTEGRNYGQLKSLPPKRSDSFGANVSELCMDLSQEFAGAIAPSDFLINLAYYTKKENASDKEIVNRLQSFVHIMNNKFRISSESPFTNLSLFDLPTLERLTENMCYPDGSKPDINYIMHIQKIFGEWFAKGDPSTGLPYRFPVVTINLSKNENGKILDEDFLDWTAKNNLSTGCFNVYINKGYKIASCCLSGSNKVIFKVDEKIKYGTVKQLYDIWEKSGAIKNVKVMGLQGFVPIKHGFKLNHSGEMLRIILKNGLYITVTPDHPSVKYENGTLVEVSSNSLRVGDLIPVSKDISYNTTGGSYDLGRFVGLFAAEGQYYKDRDTSLAFCFHTKETDLHSFVIDYAKNVFGATSKTTASKVWPNSTKIDIQSRAIHGLMRDMLIGDLAITKRLTSRVFSMSKEFRLGFINGFIEGDGYTKDNTRTDYGSMHIGNPNLGKDLVSLANSVNIKSSYHSSSNNGTTIGISTIDRNKLEVLSDYVRSQKTNSTQLKDRGDYYTVGIKTIEKTNGGPNIVYDFEVESDDHLFQIANGIITHNCRLINDAEKMRDFRSDSFGNGGLNLGSHRVVTINLPRIAIKANGDCDKFTKLLKTNLDICRDLLQVHREEILARRINLGFLKFYNPLKWFTLDSMFSTIGIIGIYEMAEMMGKEIRTDDGSNFVAKVLDTIEAYARTTSIKTGHAFNVEEIPGEGTAIKLCEKDKVIFGADRVPYELYSNQYIPLIDDASIPERIELSGKFQDRISGGGILHLNIMEKITDPEVMKHLIRYCVEKNTSHVAINYGFGVCSNGHTSVCGNSETCPECGAKIETRMSRVIGYFSIVSNWNKTRREFEFPRRVFK